MEKFKSINWPFVEKFRRSSYVDLTAGSHDVESAFEFYLKSKLRLAEVSFNLTPTHQNYAGGSVRVSRRCIEKMTKKSQAKYKYHSVTNVWNQLNNARQMERHWWPTHLWHQWYLSTYEGDQDRLGWAFHWRVTDWVENTCFNQVLLIARVLWCFPECLCCSCLLVTRVGVASLPNFVARRQG